MDRRTKIAVALIAVILGANLVMTARTQKQHLAEQQARGGQPLATQPPGQKTIAPVPGAAPPVTAVTPEPSAPTSAGPFVAATGTDGDLVIETPLQRIRIARAGGVVREMALLHYQVTGTTSPVDLASPAAAAPGRRGLGVVLRSANNTWDLASARFDPMPGTFDDSGKLSLAAGSGPRSFELRCAAEGGGAVIERWTIDPDHYDFQFELDLEPGSGMPRIDAYSIEWTTGIPQTESTPKEDQMRFRAAAALDAQIIRKRPSDFRKEESVTSLGTLHWAGVQNKYFLVGLIPATPQPGTLEFVGQAPTHWIGVRFTQPAPWRAGPEKYRIYAGPIDLDQMRALGVGLESTVELGWRWIRPISGLLLKFMEFLRSFIPNYGVIILLVSALAKLVFWPLTARSMRSMRRMQELQPRMEEIRRRYAGDPKAMNEQMMNMYKEQKVNPVGGCMPILVQTPIFFALFSVLSSNIELRNAPFVAWIDNLAAPDVLAKLPFALPFIGQNLSLLPLLMGGAMIWQSALGTPAIPSASTNPMAQQQFMMKWIMPVMMTFIFYKMPSGLVLYWIVNTLMSIAQQVHTNRTMPVRVVVPAAAPAAVGSEGRAGRGGSNRGDGAERGSGAAERAGRTGRQGR